MASRREQLANMRQEARDRMGLSPHLDSVARWSSPAVEDDEAVDRGRKGDAEYVLKNTPLGVASGGDWGGTQTANRYDRLDNGDGVEEHAGILAPAPTDAKSRGNLTGATSGTASTGGASRRIVIDNGVDQRSPPPRRLDLAQLEDGTTTRPASSQQQGGSASETSNSYQVSRRSHSGSRDPAQRRNNESSSTQEPRGNQSMSQRSDHFASSWRGDSHSQPSPLTGSNEITPISSIGHKQRLQISEPVKIQSCNTSSGMSPLSQSDRHSTAGFRGHLHTAPMLQTTHSISPPIRPPQSTEDQLPRGEAEAQGGTRSWGRAHGLQPPPQLRSGTSIEQQAPDRSERQLPANEGVLGRTPFGVEHSAAALVPIAEYGPVGVRGRFTEPYYDSRTSSSVGRVAAEDAVLPCATPDTNSTPLETQLAALKLELAHEKKCNIAAEQRIGALMQDVEAQKAAQLRLVEAQRQHTEVLEEKLERQQQLLREELRRQNADESQPEESAQHHPQQLGPHIVVMEQPQQLRPLKSGCATTATEEELLSAQQRQAEENQRLTAMVQELRRHVAELELALQEAKMSLEENAHEIQHKDERIRQLVKKNAEISAAVAASQREAVHFPAAAEADVAPTRPALVPADAEDWPRVLQVRTASSLVHASAPSTLTKSSVGPVDDVKRRGSAVGAPDRDLSRSVSPMSRIVVQADEVLPRKALTPNRRLRSSDALDLQRRSQEAAPTKSSATPKASGKLSACSISLDNSGDLLAPSTRRKASAHRTGSNIVNGSRKGAESAPRANSAQRSPSALHRAGSGNVAPSRARRNVFDLMSDGLLSGRMASSNIPAHGNSPVRKCSASRARASAERSDGLSGVSPNRGGGTSRRSTFAASPSRPYSVVSSTSTFCGPFSRQSTVRADTERRSIMTSSRSQRPRLKSSNAAAVTPNPSRTVVTWGPKHPTSAPLLPDPQADRLAVIRESKPFVSDNFVTTYHPNRIVRYREGENPEELAREAPS